MKRWTMTVIAVVFLVVLVGGGYLAYIHNLIPVITNNGTLTSPDGSVVLHIPAGAQTPGTRITFKTNTSAAKSLNETAKGFSALGSPVDIDIVSGALEPGKVQVTLSYNPQALPEGVTPTNLGMAVFDPGFDAWMPIGSTVDAKAHTISAIAPHFSTFSAIFLDPLKQVVHVGGLTINTVINAQITITRWYIDLYKQVIVSFVKDLFGIAPALTCSPQSQELTVTTMSLLNRLTACAESASKGDNTLRLRNGYGFPVRINLFPQGVTQRLSDVFTNGGDLVNLIRNGFWATQHEAVIPGANLGSLTVTSSMKHSVKLSLNLDALSVAEDVGLVVLQLFAPIGKLADAAGEGGVKAVLQEIFTVGKVEAKSGTPAAWVSKNFDMLSCINTAAHSGSVVTTSFSMENIGKLVDVARGCIATVLEKANLEGVLVDILGSLNIIPDVVEASVAEALNKALPPGFNPNTTSYTVTVTRFDAQAVYSTYLGTWHVHGYDLTIKPDNTGQDIWHDGFSPAGDWCNGNDTIAFTVMPDGSLVGTVQSSWYTPAGDGCLPGDWQPGDYFSLVHQGNHLLYQTWSDSNPVSSPNYLCDQYATGQGWNQCGA